MRLHENIRSVNFGMRANTEKKGNKKLYKAET